VFPEKNDKKDVCVPLPSHRLWFVFACSAAETKSHESMKNASGQEQDLSGSEVETGELTCPPLGFVSDIALILT
jgi:hypothetical protein